MKKVVLLFSLVIIFFTAFAQDEWIVINPFPTLEGLHDGHFTSEQEGWVVGNNIVLYTNDGGDTWETQLSTESESFRKIVFIDENEGWVLGYNTIYHTINAGDTWEPQVLPTVSGILNDIFFINNDTGWIVGNYNLVHRTTDGGDTWTNISTANAWVISLQSVSFTDGLNGCAVGYIYNLDHAYILNTNDGGLTWTETTPSDHAGFSKIIFLDSQTGWICGFDGELMKTTDGGNTWVDKSSVYYQSFNDIHFFDDNKGVLLEGVYMRLTFDAGETWDSIVYIDNTSYQYSITSWAYDELITVGYSGSIVKSLDGGNTWESINKGMTNTIIQLGFINSLEGFAITNKWSSSGLYKTVDGGYNWTVDTLMENGPFYEMYIDDQSIYLLNDSSQLVKTNNGGNDWELLDVPDINYHYADLQFVNENTGYMCDSDGLLLKTSDGGHTWVDKSLNGNFNLNTVFFVNENTGWMFDILARVILRTTNGGDDWEFSFLGDSIEHQPISIFFLNESLGYVATTEGILFKTWDGGENWEEFSYIQAGARSGIYFINEEEGWLRAGSSVYHTFDGGTSWINQQSFTTSIDNMFFLNNKGWLGGVGGLVATTNFTVNVNELVEYIPTASVFPNPAHGNIEVKLNDKSDIINDIKIFDLHGKQILDFKNLSKQNTLNINVSGLINGTYIIHITSDKNENFVKFIVK
ncbi:MAG: YCF48-related protein [Bacteroidota bacterium]